MKMKALIVETVEIGDDFIVVKFEKDPAKQKFEVYLKMPPGRFRYLDTVELDIKWRSFQSVRDDGRVKINTVLFAEKFEILETIK